MATNLEQLLLAAAAKEAEGYPSQEAAQYTGAAIGALGGAALGSVPHQIGRGLNAVSGRKPNRFKPGTRMAGGLVGAILGGALGEGVRNDMVSNSPAAAMLAKSQAGTMTPGDAYTLEQILSDTYSQIGIV